MFHNALTTLPVSVVPLYDENTTMNPDDNDNNDESDADDISVSEAKPLQIKKTFLMGKFVLDPIATDFIGKRIHLEIFHFIEFNPYFQCKFHSYTKTTRLTNN